MWWQAASMFCATTRNCPRTSGIFTDMARSDHFVCVGLLVVRIALGRGLAAVEPLPWPQHLHVVEEKRAALVASGVVGEGTHVGAARPARVHIIEIQQVLAVDVHHARPVLRPRRDEDVAGLVALVDALFFGA